MNEDVTRIKQLMAAPKSTSLFHFTRNMKSLMGVLENEWRYVPSNKDLPVPLIKELYDDKEKRKKYNDKSRSLPLSFAPIDVRYVFVKQDYDIPPLVNFINEELEHLSPVDLKIFTTRITSLEHLEKDV